MMENDKGYKAILSEMKRLHGIDVPAMTMRNYLKRLESGSTRAIRGQSTAVASDATDDEAIGGPCSSMADSKLFCGAALLPYENQIRAMLDEKKGYYAILTQLKRQHGVDVSKTTMENYVKRLQSGSTRAIRGQGAAFASASPTDDDAMDTGASGAAASSASIASSSVGAAEATAAPCPRIARVLPDWRRLT